MLVSDLLHSCANDCVAEAAVSSIGGDFALSVQSQADDGGVSVGGYAARVVREFAVHATERDWRELTSALRGKDHPVLAGLQLILERRGPTLGLNGRDDDAGFVRSAGSSHVSMVSA